MRPLALRFPDAALESAFRAEYARSSIRAARATTILVIVLYAGYLVLDLRAGTLGEVWPLRLAVVVVLSVNLALTWHPVFERIQLTARAGDRLRARYALSARGAIDVKGRGRVETYLLGERIA